METINENSIVIGCNYHTKWQSNKSMRFVLRSVKDGKCMLGTRTTKKYFQCNIEDLIFIMSDYNIHKAKRKLGLTKTK